MVVKAKGGVGIGVVLLGAVGLALGASGCGCTDSLQAGLVVSVVDGQTGAPICDATVTATDGAYMETLRPSGGNDCSYAGAWERPGTYTVLAVSGGRSAMLDSVVVPSGTCHVGRVTKTVTVP